MRSMQQGCPEHVSISTHLPSGFKTREAELQSQMQKLQQQAASNSKEADAARAQAVLTQQQLVSLQEERGKLAAAESAQIKELEALRAKEKARESERARLDEELRQLRQTRDEADRKAAEQVKDGSVRIPIAKVTLPPG